MSCPYLHRCTASIHVIHFDPLEFCTFAFIFGDTSYKIQWLRRYYLKISFCILTRCIWDNNINFRCYCLLEHHLLQFLSFRIQVELINVILWYGLSDVSKGRKMFKGCCGRRGVLYTVHQEDDMKKKGSTTAFNTTAIRFGCIQDAAHEKFNAFSFKWKINNRTLKIKRLRMLCVRFKFSWSDANRLHSDFKHRIHPYRWGSNWIGLNVYIKKILHRKMTQNRLKKQNVIKAESRKTGKTPYEIMFNRNVRKKPTSHHVFSGRVWRVGM